MSISVSPIPWINENLLKLVVFWIKMYMGMLRNDRVANMSMLKCFAPPHFHQLFRQEDGNKQLPLIHSEQSRTGETPSPHVHHHHNVFINLI